MAFALSIMRVGLGVRLKMGVIHLFMCDIKVDLV